MITIGNRIPGVIKEGALYLNYELSCRSSENLVIVFPAVDNVPSRNITSYYGYQNALNANVLHIVDNFGSHGSYLIMINNDASIQRLVVRLIKKVVDLLGLTLNNVYFVGTSKGATSAIFYAVMMGGGRVICAEPQVRIGDFLYHNGYDNSMVSKSIAYSMTGSVSVENKEYLNGLIFNALCKKIGAFKGFGRVIYGKGTGYFEKHVIHLKNFQIPGFLYIEEDFDNHGDAVHFFKNEILDAGLLMTV